MSVRRAARAVWRFAESLIRLRISPPPLAIFRRVPPSSLLIAGRRPPPPSIWGWLRGATRQLIVRNPHTQRALARPFAAWTRALQQHQQQQQRERLRRWRQIPIQRPGGAVRSGIQTIRDYFAEIERYNPALVDAKVSMPESLDEYEIGNPLGYGCHAAVYGARLRREPDREGADDRTRFPLALKLMFNYQMELRGEDRLWSEMGAELAPLPGAERLLKGRFANFRGLPRAHPNVVRMYVAFIDRQPTLPDAAARYPEAMPAAFADDDHSLIDQHRTLFVVMKRYRCTLYDYVRNWPKRNLWNGRVMLGQLLEALVYLERHTVAHRDIKSDNILLDYDSPDEAPHLVLSDFGASLTVGRWTVEKRRREDDFYEPPLDGNAATRAPEVVCAIAAAELKVDYARADAWAAGTIGYELFTRRNPFYGRLKSQYYDEEVDLPTLPGKLPKAVRAVVRGLLRREPEARTSVAVAANTLVLGLFGWGVDVRKKLVEIGLDVRREARNALTRIGKQKKGDAGGEEGANRELRTLLTLFAAETMAARAMRPPMISRAELQLRATFLSRLDAQELWPAVDLILEAGDHLGSDTDDAESAGSSLVVQSTKS